MITKDKKALQSNYTLLRLSRKNGNPRGASKCCINYLNSFCTASERYKHYASCVDHETVKIEMSLKRGKIVEYHDGENQFKVPFTMYTDFRPLVNAHIQANC